MGLRDIWRVCLEIHPLHKSNEKHTERKEHITGVKAEEFRKGRILAGLRDVWRVCLEILPLQKSKEKPIETYEKPRTT